MILWLNEMEYCRVRLIEMKNYEHRILKGEVQGETHVDFAPKYTMFGSTDLTGGEK